MIVSLLALAVALPLVGDALRRLERRALDRTDLALWIGLTVAMLGAHTMTIALPGAPVLGFQGAAFLAIVLGYCRAVLSLALVLALTVPPMQWGSGVLVDALLPVWSACVLAALLRRYGPQNLFVFLFGMGVFAVFAIGAVQLAAGFALDALRAAPGVATVGTSDAFAYGLLLLGGEATLAGMVITVLVVYLPRRVALFDDDHYLSAGRAM